MLQPLVSASWPGGQRPAQPAGATAARSAPALHICPQRAAAPVALRPPGVTFSRSTTQHPVVGRCLCMCAGAWMGEPGPVGQQLGGGHGGALVPRGAAGGHVAHGPRAHHARHRVGAARHLVRPPACVCVLDLHLFGHDRRGQGPRGASDVSRRRGTQCTVRARARHHTPLAALTAPGGGRVSVACVEPFACGVSTTLVPSRSDAKAWGGAGDARGVLLAARWTWATRSPRRTTPSTRAPTSPPPPPRESGRRWRRRWRWSSSDRRTTRRRRPPARQVRRCTMGLGLVRALCTLGGRARAARETAARWFG